MKDFTAFLDIGRYKIGLIRIGSWKYLSEDLSYQSPPLPRPKPAQFSSVTQSVLISALHTELLSKSVESQQLQQHVILSL